MKRTLPVLIAAVVGLILLADYFLKIPAIKQPATEIQDWGLIIAAFALALASVNLIMIHGKRVARKDRQSIHSAILIISLFVTAYSGIFMGTKSKVFTFIFNSMYTPLAAVFYAMTAFHLASASYRAFRAKNAQAVVLLVAGVLLMLGNAPVGEAIWKQFPVIASWITNVLNLAGSRGILISTAVGTIGAGIRILAGIDRSHLGSGAE